MTSQEQHDEHSAERTIDFEAGRRAFMKAAGFGGVLASFAAAATSEASAQAAGLDVAILNFALNLEYLEGEFYRRGLLGVGLPAEMLTGLGNQGAVTGGQKVPFRNAIVRDVVAEIANDEMNHIAFIRSTLGSQAVAEPAISLDTAFAAAAAAAGLPASFNPFADDFSFLLGAYTLTEVGVTAYQGAAPFITSRAVLAAAGGIFATEAYHIGTIRSLLFAQQNAFYTAATADISTLRRTLSGANDDQGIAARQSTLNGGAFTPSNITNTDANAINFARTPRQVLNIVYGARGAQRGGFYPNGTNPGPGGRQLVAATSAQ